MNPHELLDRRELWRLGVEDAIDCIAERLLDEDSLEDALDEDTLNNICDAHPVQFEAYGAAFEAVRKVLARGEGL